MKTKSYKYTEGPLLKGVWALAWPAVASMFLETFMLMADAFWVGKLGPSEMAAVTSSMFPMWAMFSVMSIISTGAVAIISRAVGADEPGEVSRIAGRSLQFALYVGFGFGLIGLAISPWLFDIMGTELNVTRMGTRYLRIFFIGLPLFFINNTISGVFRAIGDSKAAMFIYTAALSANILLDPILIFGWGPVPRLGTDGASIATGLAAACGLITALFLNYRGRFSYRWDFKLFRLLTWSLIRTIVRIGFPPAVAGITFSVVYIFLNRVIAEFGTISIAALMVGNRMESISYMTCFGFYIAASTLVGQNLGAKKAGRAARSAWVALGITVSFTFVISIAFLVFPRQLSTLFTSDEQVIMIAIDYLKILALSQIFMAAEIVLEGAFAGAGNTIPPMVVSIPGSILRLPLAYYLAFTAGLGINGVWWALTITTWVKGMIIIYWFWLGRWKKTGLLKT